MSAFLDGLRDSSPRIVLASIALAALALAALEVGFSRDLVWRLPARWLLATPYDDWTHALLQVKRLGAGGPLDRTVFMLGGSSAREVSISDEAVSRSLAEAAGARYDFVNLGTRNQSFGEAIAIVENLPDARRSLIVFAVNPYLFQDSEKELDEALRGVRFPIRSPALVAAARSRDPNAHEPWPLEIVRYRGIVTNYVRRRVRRGEVLTPLVYEPHMYDARRPLTSAALFEKFVKIGRDMRAFPRNAPGNVALLRAAIDVARAKGYRTLLLSLPRKPQADEVLFAPYLDAYHAQLEQLAESSGADFIDAQAHSALVSADFYDHIHLRPGARTRYHDAFVASIARELGPTTGNETAPGTLRAGGLAGAGPPG